MKAIEEISRLQREKKCPLTRTSGLRIASPEQSPYTSTILGWLCMAHGRCCKSLKRTGTNLYFWACVVYVAYVTLILTVNYCQDIFPNTPLPHNKTLRTLRPNFHRHVLQMSDSDYDYDYIIAWQCQSKGDTPLNREFIAASMVPDDRLDILNSILDSCDKRHHVCHVLDPLLQEASWAVIAPKVCPLVSRGTFFTLAVH